MKICRKDEFSERGAAIVEFAIVVGFLLIAGVAVLLSNIVPAYLGTSGEDRIFAANESQVIDSNSTQELTIEGFQLRDNDGAIQSSMTKAMTKMEALSGIAFCAAVHTKSGGVTSVYYREKDGLTDCPPPSSAVHIQTDFISSLDGVQEGEEVGIAIYPDPRSSKYEEHFVRLRRATSAGATPEY